MVRRTILAKEPAKRAGWVLMMNLKNHTKARNRVRMKKKQKEKLRSRSVSLSVFVPKVGIEPTLPKEHDF
ncbi:MAG: hypothetical protein OEY34_09435, partial [Cyclobacteriaceae bacterium]|nr:hypothetical protein [Cyclobacteriaceae bacterium]